MRALHAAVADFLFEFLGPSAGDALSREMHDGIELEQLLGIKRVAGCPLHLTGLRDVANESDSLVAPLRQFLSQCAAD